MNLAIWFLIFVAYGIASVVGNPLPPMDISRTYMALSLITTLLGIIGGLNARDN